MEGCHVVRLQVLALAYRNPCNLYGLIRSVCCIRRHDSVQLLKCEFNEVVLLY